MLALVNANRMVPPIAPVGLEYVAGAARKAGIDVEVVDLSLADDPVKTLQDYFAVSSPHLVGISFRNVDDCFWPSGEWFAPELSQTIRKIRALSDAPIVLGGVGFSIFAGRIVDYTGADFGIRGDGEEAIVLLYNALCGVKDFAKIDGLIWRRNGAICSNEPTWPSPLSLSTSRDMIDNRAYFNRSGQCGVETKRGCNRSCVYCADPIAKGTKIRLRKPAEIADEVESLLAQGIDVLHLCDSEFNIPRDHAYAVCEEFIRRSLGEKVRWYTYMAVVPFDVELAQAMRKAGCVGIDFTGDSASSAMLKAYRQTHRPDDLGAAVRLCREHGITVMVDLLLGGPGETADTIAETIDYIKKIGPDCAGAPLGIRVYPGTEMARVVANEGPPDKNPNIRRRYTDQVDFFQPTFYISHELGSRPAKVVRDLIGGDQRFFAPMDEVWDGGASTDHNYNDNTQLVEAISRGARGAFWDILRGLRNDDKRNHMG